MNKEKDFQEVVKDLQRKIEHDEEETYSKKVINEYRNPVNFGFIENPDAFGEIKGSCGDTMRISLSIENDEIVDACFWTDGCGASLACGNMLTSMIKGKNIDHALLITSDELTSMLGGLPEENLHCSILAVTTLHLTIENYKKNRE